jgi:hypothetical protein
MATSERALGIDVPDVHCPSVWAGTDAGRPTTNAHTTARPRLVRFIIAPLAIVGWCAVDSGKRVRFPYRIGAHACAGRTLSTEPTDLSGFEFQKDIKVGRLRKGMTKEEAILARGYPPVHRTYSTEDDRWIYQQNRFAVQMVVFADGKLIEGRDIY